MSGIPKVLLGLALGLPVGGYAVGSLVSTSAEPPGERAPIILEDPPPPSETSRPGAGQTPPRTPTDPEPEPEDGRLPDDDGRPEVVVPSYVDRGDDDDDDDDDGGADTNTNTLDATDGGDD